MNSIRTINVEAMAEYEKRRSLALTIFRPQPHQEPFFTEYAREFLLRGGNRSGKSTCADVLFGAIATDTPITLNDGRQIDCRQPWQKGRCLTMWVIGYDSKHIGQTIYRLLFKPGLFKTVVDKKTRRIRAHNFTPEDEAEYGEGKDSNPIIPGAFVDKSSWDWENKKGKEFKSVTIWHPQTHEPLAQIYAYSSKAEPKAGDPVDVIWIDEAIENPSHYKEWQARLVDRRGRIFWSSWPKADNEALMSLTERAEDEKDKPVPLVREIVISTSANQALSKDKKDEFIRGFVTEADRRARDRGEYVTDLQRSYPLYNPDVHRVTIRTDVDSIPKEDKIGRILSATDGIPPREWTRELILDPGTTHPGVLLCAIPPPSFGKHYIVYQEIYPGRMDATELATVIRKHTFGLRFHRFIIDDQAGQQQQMGYEAKVRDNYTRAFKKERIKSKTTGYKFIAGCKDVGGRMGRLREWLHYSDEDDFPVLMIVNHRCPILCKQLKSDKQQRVNNEVKEDRPAPGQTRDLCVCLEYWAASNPVYVPYQLQPEDGGDVYMQFIKKYGRNKKRSESTAQIGPSYVAG